MRDVSKRVYEAVLEALTSSGSDTQVIRELDHDVAQIEEWSTWDQWLDFLVRVAVLTRDRGGLRCLGRYFTRVESFSYLRRIYAVFTTPKLNYMLVGRWVGNSVFPEVKCDTVDLGDGRLRQTLTLPDSYADSPEFFELMWGALVASPNFLGLPSAHVEMSRELRRATYTILPPPALSWLSRCGRALRTLRKGVDRDVVTLFSQMVEQLQESHREMQALWEQAETRSEELRAALAESQRASKARDELEWRIQEREQDDQLLARLGALSEGTLDRELLARLADFLEAADASEQ